MLFDKIKELSKKRSMNIKDVALKIGFSENYFYTLKSGKTPSSENLVKIASFFNVSTDYLLDVDSIKLKEIDISDDILVLKLKGEVLSKKERAVILATAQALIEQRESK